MTLIERFKNQILILDGAMGTALQNMNLLAADFGGELYNGCNEYLVLSKPDAIYAVHASYLEAGADIIETNTFGATSVVLAEYELQDKTEAINREAVRLARKACDFFSTPDKPRFVAGAMGPTTKSLSVTGGITFDEMRDTYAEQAAILVDCGVDYLLLETALDTLNLKAAYCGCLIAFKKVGRQVPIAISGTIETMGTMLAGQDVEAFYTSIAHMTPLYIGLNCATGPAFMRDHIRTLSAISAFPVGVAPNAGIPDGDGVYAESPEDLADILTQFADSGWVNLVGGCCGTTPAHIFELAQRISHLPPRVLQKTSSTRISGIESLTLENDARPYIVGERTNVIGSRAFKRLITQEKFDEAAEIARKQVRSGAHIVDICLSNPDRDEVQDIELFIHRVRNMTKAPFMIDSQSPEVVEAAFKLIQGKCILNSVNLEDKGKTFKTLLPLVKQYGAAVVVGCIEDEMAVTAQQKLEVAQKSYQILTQEYGILEEDIIFDPLVFPCGTGDEKYIGSGKETIEGVRLIKHAFPKCKTVLGISNISFGLPSEGREILNTVFLYHCTKAGLDLAIVNSEKLERYAQISDLERELCNNLLWYRTNLPEDPVTSFAAHFREKLPQAKTIPFENLTVSKRLEINIVQGTKEHLISTLDEALKEWDPLGVINGPLMDAMSIVGRMFNNNELIVAEVLQSAEVMKAAVTYLETFMDKLQTHHRGTLLLATVKGDVHDIGKNLVQIILGNNGYKIIDLGIKCPPETLISAYYEHKPDLIGLSGLLVKSAQQMVLTAKDFKLEGISIPILVGGAALTQMFTQTRISPEYGGPVIYCKDAMTGLSVANQLMDPIQKVAFLQTLNSPDQVSESTPHLRGATKRTHRSTLTFDFSNIQATAPHFDPVIVKGDLATIWSYINPQMLYGNHLGIKGNYQSLLAKKDPKLMKLVTLMDSLKNRILNENLLSAKGIYQFFKVKPKGDSLHILDSVSEDVIQTFKFPRQSEGLGLCLTDFINPEGDTLCMFVVSCGDGVIDLAKTLMEQGNYFEAHALSALALESAEGFSEWLHHDIRSKWGIPDPEELSLEDTFKLKYTGIRVSFGYPACPRLEDQALLFNLLKPECIGATLSESYMMSPEASVSALVFHHPQARYFTISESDLDSFIIEREASL